MDQPLFGEPRPRDRYLNLGLTIGTIALFMVRWMFIINYLRVRFMVMHLKGNGADGIRRRIFTRREEMQTCLWP